MLDVGSGIGGPARFLAARLGAAVTALDATSGSVGSPKCSPVEPVFKTRVTVVRGDALSLPFADGTFDIVWTQALSQNIFDKRRFISELARVLRPGGRLAMFELVAGPGGPWCTRCRGRTRASRARSSAPTELQGLLEAEGLAVGPINRGQAVLESIFAAAAQLTPSPPSSRWAWSC